MIFEIGKFYKHTTGHTLAILGELQTFMWGKTLIAESNSPNKMTELMCVWKSESSTVNYTEISKEEYMKNYC